MGDSQANVYRKNPRRYSQFRATALAAAVGLVAVRPAAAIVIRDDTSDSQYLALGAQSQYSPIGFVQVITSDSGGTINYNFGTATLIAPDWILTAAHVVTSTSNGTTTTFPTSGMYFGQGTTMSFHGPDTVTNVYTESGWDGDITQGDDLALLQLSTPITNIAPAQLYPSVTTSLLNMTATAVGYGYTGNGLTGFSSTNPADNTRRAMQNVIDTNGGSFTNGGPPLNETYSFTTYSPNILFTDFDSPNPTVAATENVMGSATPLPLEGATAPGDSGGGLFVTSGGQTYLAGVTSFGATFAPSGTPTGIYGEVSAFTSVSAPTSNTFITSTLADNANWSSSFGGTWDSLNNWSTGDPPEFRRSAANFAAGISANSSVTLDGDWTVGTLTFNNTNSYTLASGSGGVLTLDNSPSSLAAAIVDSGGSHFISAPIQLNSKLNISVANAGDTLTISGPISGNVPLRFTGPGTLVLSGSNTYSTSTTVTSGQLRIGAAAALPAGTTLALSSTTSSAALLSDIGTVQLSSLTIASGATFDVGNNALAINYSAPSPVATIAAELAAGYNAGTWTGAGINSSAAASNPDRFSIGYADGNLDVATAAQPNQVLVKYTLAGDANLDGSVGFADLVAVAQHFGFTGQDWADGNFTYALSGSVGFADLVLVAQNFGDVLGSSASVSPSWALPLAAVGQVQAASAVPEPAALALLVLPACGLLRRRRKR